MASDPSIRRPEQLLAQQWRDHTRECRNSLEREDLDQALDCLSWDDVLSQATKTQENGFDITASTDLKTGLEKLKSFVNAWMSQVDNNIDLTLVYGLLKLVITLVQQDRVQRVPPMLSEVLGKIGVLNSYFEEATTFTLHLKEACVGSARIMLSFLSYTVKYIRMDMPMGRTISANQWRPLDDRFRLAIQQLDEQCSRAEKYSTFTMRSQPAEVLQNMVEHVPSTMTTLAVPTPQPPALHDDEAKLPCIVLPNALTLTPRFFDRQDIINRIEDYFSGPKAEESFLSLAIHGLGGVGKSTVALKYAYLKYQRRELDALFWVHSEKVVSIKESFTQIAVRLKLPGAQPADHEENQALLLDWLQRTSCRWLIVYDNAEDPDLLRQYWPLANRGQALITTRNFLFGYELADRPLEILSWDSATGLRFLLSLLSSDISEELQGDEFDSAQQLSQKLQGHALAITTMAGVMHRRALTITEFMDFYGKHSSSFHDGISGNRSINTLWEISFQSLDHEAFMILGVMSYIEPDSIPHALFEPSSTDCLSEPYRFCADHYRFFAAIESLLTQGLLKREKASRKFSLHRLVQEAFRHFMTPEQRQQSFHSAVALVSDKFPHEGELGQLYLVWEICALYLQHVISLKDNFREAHRTKSNLPATMVFCELNNRCQRYLLETNAHQDLADMIEVNKLAVGTIPAADVSNTFLGALYSHHGQLLTRIGQGEEGVVWLRKSWETFALDLPESQLDVAWAADNAATGIASINEFEEAMSWYDLARDQWIEWHNRVHGGDGNWPPGLKTSVARGWFWGGRVLEARQLATESLQQVETTKPYSWNLAAGTHHLLGTIERHDRNFDLAKSHFIEAQNLWLRGDRMRSDPFYGSCLYRQGCTALDMGQVEAAIKHLNDAVAATEKRKNTLVFEYIRCLFKLSEAMEQEPRGVDEARHLYEQAERLLQRHAPRAKPVGKESTYDALVVLSWR